MFCGETIIPKGLRGFQLSFKFTIRIKLKGGAFMSNIGDIIREHRVKENLTQEELGAKLFLSKQTISKWENNRSQPDLETTQKLIEILKIDPSEMLSGEKGTQNTLPQKNKTIKNIAVVLGIAAVVVLGAIIIYNGMKSNLELGIGKPVMPKHEAYYETIVISTESVELTDKEREISEEISGMTMELYEAVEEYSDKGYEYHIEAKITVKGFKTTISYEGDVIGDGISDYHNEKTFDFIPAKYPKD